MDKIFLHGVQCECVIGVWKWEQKITQTLVLDIELACDVPRAAASDELADAVDYKHLTERVLEVARARNYALIETLIEDLAKMILDEFETPWVKIKLDKGGAVKNVKHVGVIIERGKQE